MTKERFEPPIWEDIEDSYEFRWFDKDNEVYKFYVNKYIDVIVIIKMFDCVSIFNKEASKKNYIKACEIVRDLF